MSGAILCISWVDQTESNSWFLAVKKKKMQITQISISRIFYLYSHF